MSLVGDWGFSLTPGFTYWREDLLIGYPFGFGNPAPPIVIPVVSTLELSEDMKYYRAYMGQLGPRLVLNSAPKATVVILELTVDLNYYKSYMGRKT